jgi:hypothetical protein
MLRDFSRKAAESTCLAHFHASETSAGKSMMARDSGGKKVLSIIPMTKLKGFPLKNGGIPPTKVCDYTNITSQPSFSIRGL